MPTLVGIALCLALVPTTVGTYRAARRPARPWLGRCPPWWALLFAYPWCPPRWAPTGQRAALRGPGLVDAHLGGHCSSPIPRAHQGGHLPGKPPPLACHGTRHRSTCSDDASQASNNPSTTAADGRPVGSSLSRAKWAACSTAVNAVMPDAQRVAMARSSARGRLDGVRPTVHRRHAGSCRGLSGARRTQTARRCRRNRRARLPAVRRWHWADRAWRYPAVADGAGWRAGYEVREAGGSEDPHAPSTMDWQAVHCRGRTVRCKPDAMYFVSSGRQSRPGRVPWPGPSFARRPGLKRGRNGNVCTLRQPGRFGC